jgi:predicted amidohydrolase YtcJ
MRLQKLIIAAYLLFFLASCKEKADVILINAQVYNNDLSLAKSSGLAIKNGCIVSLDLTNNLLHSWKADTIIDLKNKFIYPAFNDAHCHFVGYAGDMFKCQLYNTSSFNEVIDRLKKYADTTRTNFIYGRGWNQNDWKVKTFPSNELLNQIFTDKIVFLKRIDGHAALINQTLIEKSKEALAPYLNTDYVEKKNGKLTGIIFDNAMEAVEALLPKIPKASLIKNILQAQNDCLSLGITSVSDAGLSYDEIALIDSLQKSHSLHIKINAMMMARVENMKKFEAKPISNTDLLRIQSLKVYCDGALGSRGACLKKAYNDDATNYGKINITKVELDKICAWAIKNNFQVCAHAIGDSTVSFVLNTYKKFLKPHNQLRWRIEHVQVCDTSDYKTFIDYNIIASVQPTHATSDMYWAVDRLGSDRIKQAYSYGTLAKNKITLALGTDFPVEYLQPLYTFYAAVSRKDAYEKPTNGFQMQDALTRQQAMNGCTYTPAYAEFAEQKKGKLMVGYAADFIVCDVNLLKDPLIKIRNSNILETYVDGKLQWRSK